MPQRARRWGGSRVISTPSNRMVPAVGASAPEIALNRVVLPAPFGPMMARRSPDLTESVTPSTARNASNATRIELDGLAQRRIVELGLEDRVDQGRAVVGLAAELLDRAGDPHHARVHREAVERGDLAVLLGMLLDEFLRHRIGRAFGELGG